MLYLRYLLLVFVGLSSGAFVAGGIFAFITMIGVVGRLAARSKTVKFIKAYEDVAVLGASIGNLIYLYLWSVPFGNITLAMSGFFSGIYVGCLSFALAEVLNVFPVFIKRVKLNYGLPYIILVFAVGKFVGALYHLFS